MLFRGVSVGDEHQSTEQADRALGAGRNGGVLSTEDDQQQQSETKPPFM
jgi:hypothetical protein